MTDEELIGEIEAQRALMVAVATGGPRIQEVDAEYRRRRIKIQQGLTERGLQDPNPHTDLWRWYGTWSRGAYPSYNSRRVYMSELYEPLIDRIRRGRAKVGSEFFEEPTGWARVDRGMDKVRERLETASTEKKIQATLARVWGEDKPAPAEA